MKILKYLIVVSIIGLVVALSINIYMIFKEKNKIYSIKDIRKHDIALILGCSVHKDGTPSKMLKDRLDKGIYLYEHNYVKRILVSGDHSNSYSEVKTMKEYLINNGINEDDVLTDYEGYNTSTSIKNYYKAYKDKSVIIVTQKYHLYRSLYISDKYHLNSIGVPAKQINYNGQIFRDIREVLARIKDFILTKEIID